MPVVTLALICAILALICFILAAVGVAARVNLLALGLFLWLLANMLKGSA
jgi:hypothetical protein